MATTEDFLTIARAARTASVAMQSITNEQKNEALLAIQQCLQERRLDIAAANEIDKKLAQDQVAAGTLSQSLFKRLDITHPDKFDAMVSGVGDICSLPDPTQHISLATQLDTDLNLYRVSVPVGVLLTIFEARPEVVVNISCLALKSGNAVILKGGKEATHTNAVLAKVIQDALHHSSIPREAVQIIETREAIRELLDLDRYIDLVVPRGSNSLVKYIQNNTRIPVLGHADGICSVYVDQEAAMEKAIKIAVDAKTHYPAACNAAETLLVHSDWVTSGQWLVLATALVKAGVVLRCESTLLPALQSLDQYTHQLQPATSEDFDTEFLDKIMAVKAVGSVEEAIEHINEHGSKHTDCIVTENKDKAEKFMSQVDAAGCYWNASTRFADGFRYGFGAEVGVSTNKTHARGPVGLEGLVIYKYRMYGNGNAASDYGSQQRQYLHTKIAPEDYQL
ncbi:glutamate-5-semialdehyde dehydrogenase [Spinellus fusiger]|nr:glutamate-5-semialdehyde dehydrogenase [Spinellus fusiger]